MKIHPELDLGPSVRFSTVIPSSNENRGLLELKDDSLTFQIQQSVQLSSTELLSCAKLTLCNPMTAALQASLSITNSRSLPKLMSIESVMSSNHVMLWRLLLFLSSIFPSIGVFSNESVLCIRRPNITVLASASVLPMNIQDWFPLGWIGCISLHPKGLSRVFSNATVQKHQFSCAQLSL